MLELAQIALVRVQTAGGTKRVGTGYAVTADRVLTSRHVWRGKEGESPGLSAEVYFLNGGDEWINVSVEWESKPKWDACLLRLPGPVGGHRAPGWGEYDRSEAVEWESYGFPIASEVDIDEAKTFRESAWMSGTLGRGGVRQGFHELIVHGPAAGAMQWAGASGAPVFVDGCLVSVTCSFLNRFGGTRGWATPVECLLEDEAFRRAVGEPVLRWVPASVLSQPLGGASPHPLSPGELLKAKNRVVPFFERARCTEWNSLAAWRDKDEQLDIRLFTGPGGVGKTRLFIEWCQVLQAQGWDAGFLPGQTSERNWFAALLKRKRRTFVVIDYAETYPRLREILARIASSSECERIRVALLARHAGGWWQALRETSQPHGAYLNQHIELSRVTLAEDMRAHAFEQAYREFARRHDRSEMQPPFRNLQDPLYARMLYIHMAALAALAGEDTQAAELVPWVLNREQEYWQRCLYENARDVNTRIFTERAQRCIAAITLRGGVASRHELRELNKRVEGPEEDEFVALLEDLYPGPTKNDDAGAYLSGLEPDLLGEELVARVLGDRRTPRDYIERVLEDAEQRVMIEVFTVLDRVAVEQRELVRPWLERALAHDIAGRAEVVLKAALASSKKEAVSPLGPVLTDSLRQRGTVDIARALQRMLPSMLPDDTVSLRELAVWVWDTCLQALPGEDKDERVERARLLHNLGIAYNAVGKWAESLAVTEKAVAIRRKLAQEQPQNFLPRLAESLNNLSLRYGDLGKRAEALAMAEEAVAIDRKLAKEQPQAFQVDLATSLDNLGHAYDEMGKWAEALAVTEEAINILRRLAEGQPQAFRPSLAATLNNLGVRYGEMGKRAEAMAATAEAVVIYRRLVEEQPQAFQSNLATSLSNLGNRYSELDKRAEALGVTEEAVAIERKLAKEQPQAFQPDLARSLNNLGIRYRAVGKRAEAVAVTEEATAIFRRLAEEQPQAFRPDLIQSLINLRAEYNAMGKQAKAVAVTEEAVARCKRLAEEQPQAFQPDLARSLDHLGIQYNAVGRRADAIAVTKKAIAIYRRLAKEQPQAFLPKLGLCLKMLAVWCSGLGKQNEALAAATEAVMIYRRLAKEQPETFLPDLAMNLSHLSIDYSAMGKRAEALAADTEAVAIYRRLSKEQPEAFLPDLARSLKYLGSQCNEQGARAEALAAATEAVTLYRRLTKEHPETFLPDLATSLNFLGMVCSELGKHAEAVAAAAEVATIYRSLAREQPQAVLPDLARSLNNLGDAYHAVDKRAEALAVAEEAVTIWRGLTEEQPESFLLDLAASLGNLGKDYSALGMRAEALAVTEEAVAIYRRLAEEQPEMFLPELAKSLDNLGIANDAVGKRAEALAAVAEAAEIYNQTMAFKGHWLARVKDLIKHFFGARKNGPGSA